MKIKDLIKILEKEKNKNLEIVVGSDAEGNNFSLLSKDHMIGFFDIGNQEIYDKQDIEDE